jgi:hypothetical protein
VLELSGYTLENKHWVTVKASFDDTLADRFMVVLPVASPLPGADGKEPPPPAKSPFETAVENAKVEAEKLSKQATDWAYSIAAYKYDEIFKPLESLLKNK